MPYSVDWYIEDELIYLYYWDETTPDELRASLLEIQTMTQQSSRPLVHIFTDVGDVTKPVTPKESLDIIRDVGTNDKSGWNIILREKSIMMKIGIAFGTSIFKTRTRTFDTIEEAEAFLAEKDPTINWDNVNKSVLTH